MNVLLDPEFKPITFTSWTIWWGNYELCLYEVNAVFTSG